MYEFVMDNLFCIEIPCHWPKISVVATADDIISVAATPDEAAPEISLRSKLTTSNITIWKRN
jgi:hypothetical protein